MEPADPSQASCGSRLICNLGCNSLRTNLGKMWKGMQKVEFKRKRLTEECVIAQRNNVMHGRGRALV